MPVQCPSIGSKSNKPHGFSIDDIIKVDRVAPSSYRSPPSSTTYLPPITWLPSSTNIYQLHRESVLQYLRHSHPFPSAYWDDVSSAKTSGFSRSRSNRCFPSEFLPQAKTQSNGVHTRTAAEARERLREEPLHRRRGTQRTSEAFEPTGNEGTTPRIHYSVAKIVVCAFR